jgi:type I restriction enzyme, S subunit
MKIETFFEKFDILIESPNPVPKLREMVLHLAVKGKLVQQDSKDHPANELLREIKAEKERLVQDEKAKASKLLPPITSDEEPYRLPPGWEWERLGNIGDTNIGLTYSPQDISDKGIPVLRSNNMLITPLF